MINQSGDLSLAPMVKNESLTFRVYSELRYSLIRGHFAPGQRLVHRQIAKQLEVSPTPVREALLRLASEGALDFDSRGVVVVPRLDTVRYSEILSLRVELEGRAAAAAASNADPQFIRTLEEAHARMMAAKDAQDRDTVLNENEKFHFTLIEKAGMPVLRRLIELLWIQCGPTIGLLYERPIGKSTPNHAHLAIIDALKRRDAAAAKAAMGNDLSSYGSQILARLMAVEAEIAS